MRTSIPLLWACAILATFAGSAAPAAAGQSSRVELSVEVGSAKGGGIATVPIRLLSSVGVGAVQFEIVYDPEVLRFKETKKGPLLCADSIEANLVRPGRVRVALVSEEEIKGVGVLLTAEFEVLDGPTGTTVIGLEGVRGWDSGNKLPIGVTSRSNEWTRVSGAGGSEGGLRWAYGVTAAAVAVVVLLLLRRRSLEIVAAGR